MQPDTLDLDYTPDALYQWFSSVADKPWAMLLTSGQASHSDSRFDIMCADPITTLVTDGKQTRITRQQQNTLSPEDPLALVQQELDRLPRLNSQSEPLPFTGGAMGLFGYDLARRFETLPDHACDELQTPDMAVGIYDWAMIADHKLRKLTLLSVGNINNRLQWLQQQRPASRQPFRLLSDWQSNMSLSAYQKKFTAIMDYIRAGDCYQINLAQRFNAEYQGDEWQAFHFLSQKNQAPFSAFIRLDSSAILSLSPERFLKVNQKQIETKPIKGTRPRSCCPEKDQQAANALLSSAKDRAENLMIVDLLRNDIGRVAEPGSVTVPELFYLESFPSVHHLVSTVQGILPEKINNTDLLRACFPGGSITGAPKIRAMEIIDELEPCRRNAWCGSIGYLSLCGRMDTSITIRTLVAENNHLYCTAGGGIVADSHVDEEYQETLDKLNRILPALTALSALNGQDKN